MYPRRQYPNIVEVYAGVRLIQIFWPIVVGIAVAIVVLFCMLLNGIFGQADGTVIFTDIILGLVFVVLPLSALTLMILGLMRLAGVKPKAARVAPRVAPRVEPRF